MLGLSVYVFSDSDCHLLSALVSPVHMLSRAPKNRWVASLLCGRKLWLSRASLKCLRSLPLLIMDSSLLLRFLYHRRHRRPLRAFFSVSASGFSSPFLTSAEPALWSVRLAPRRRPRAPLVGPTRRKRRAGGTRPTPSAGQRRVEGQDDPIREMTDVVLFRLSNLPILTLTTHQFLSHSSSSFETLQLVSPTHFHISRETSFSPKPHHTHIHTQP